MIVYGDRNQWSSADAWFRGLDAQLARARAVAHDQALELRDALTRLAIDTGAIAQALLDREFAATLHDECSALSDAAAAACRATADGLRALAREAIAWSPIEQALARLRELAPEEPLCLRDPEGFAFYALYPELYLDAAMRCWCAPPVQVIGIRSIGTTLAGVVAAGLESTLPLVTVRPVGDAFARELRVGPRLAAQLLADRERRRYAIVDEGPGLSGSSFAAVARYLCERGVERSQLLFFPSHAGEPGPHAPPSERQRYLETTRCHTSFEDYFDAERRISAWFERELGAPVSAAHDVGAGRWRALAYAREDYPVTYARDERRKFLLATTRGEWLLKFTGLGGRAPALAARARCLSEHGYTPELIGVRHGFMLTRYVRDAEPLARANLPRDQLLAALAGYLGFIAQHFPSDARLGAGPDALLAMLEYNARTLLGPELTQSLQRWQRELPALRASWRPTATDNKLDVYEWLVTRDGRLLKCDAHDHHAAHDCIGSQDPAWDVAGAAIELGLAAAELDELCKALRDRAGLQVSAAKLRFCELAYLAFRAGRASFGEASLRGWADADAELVQRERERYVRELERRLRR